MTLLSAVKREKYLSLTDQEAYEILYDWEFWAREGQLPPKGEWLTWLVLAGRGYGKNRSAAEYVRDIAYQGKVKKIALVGQTVGDVREVMIEGPESGLLDVHPPWFKPIYEPSKRRITWPNGVTASTYSGDTPDQLRGPQHGFAWVDELAKFKYPQETWDNLMFGLRIGDDPRTVVTTTPRPIKIIKELKADESTVTTVGSTYENIDNLSLTYQKQVAKYEGTRIGRQELNAEILDDNPGALWSRSWLDRDRKTDHPRLVRIVVGVDPAVSNTETSSHTGVVVVGKCSDEHYYVLDDSSLKASPHGWGSAAVSSYNKYKADRVVGEVNNGGDMVGFTIETVDKKVAFKKVHASRGKQTRAEPVSAISEQKKLHMVGSFPELEDELCEWEPESGMDSPDRLDAMVWAITELMGGKNYGNVTIGSDFARISPNMVQ